MIKNDMGTMEIKGNELDVVAELINLIMRIKEFIKDERLLELLNEELLCCVQNKNVKEFYRNEEINMNKLVDIMTDIIVRNKMGG